MKPAYLAFIALVLSSPLVALGADRAAVIGKVTETSGHPVEHATVIIYEAYDKGGLRTNCPTCWIDCGKRTTTDKEGSFRIDDLDPQLRFTLLILRDGFSAAYVRNVDPALGPAQTAVLATHPVIEEVNQLVRGKVVDARGKP